jgi:ribulose-phosphate 3-epimerase
LIDFVYGEKRAMKLIAPSILSADFARLGREIQAVADAGADWIHIDVMDGHYVPNITFGPLAVEAARRVTDLPLDVHLMIENPDAYIRDFASAGADMISVQAEACTHLNRTIQLIIEQGVKPGLALNPATPLTCLEWVLEELYFVLIMSVNPGFGGQAFIPNSLDKVRALKRILEQKGLETLIQVDGGVNPRTLPDLAQAGADVLVAGSAIFGTPDYQRTIAGFRELLQEVPA